MQFIINKLNGDNECTCACDVCEMHGSIKAPRVIIKGYLENESSR